MKRCILLLTLFAVCSSLPGDAGADDSVLDAQAANMKVIRQYNWYTMYRVKPDAAAMVEVSASARVTTTGEVIQHVVTDNEHAEAAEVWDGEAGETEAEEAGYMKLDEVAKLVYDYGLMSFEDLRDFLAEAESSDGEGDMEGTTAYHSTDVLQDGDEMTLWVDSESGLSRKLEFSSEALEVPVEVTATYRTLENGAVVLNRGRIHVPGKPVTVDFLASGYRFTN